MGRNDDCPCNGCTKRYVGCHAECKEDYIPWAENKKKNRPKYVPARSTATIKLWQKKKKATYGPHKVKWMVDK